MDNNNRCFPPLSPALLGSAHAPARVLVADDDPRVGREIAAHLDTLGCTSRLVADGEAASAEACASRWDLVILAVVLRAVDGLEVFRRWRAHEARTPIMMMAAQASEVAAVLDLEPMADDCLIKPFGPLELAARVARALRRVARTPEQRSTAAGDDARTIEIDGLRMDLARRRVQVNGRPVELTTKEFHLLVQFATSPGRVFSRAELLDRIWSHAPGVYEHTVDSHVNRLRGKIERDGAKPGYIQTVRGAGYRFAERLA
jgi:DNA-binding response OmpR family regulator